MTNRDNSYYKFGQQPVDIFICRVHDRFNKKPGNRELFESNQEEYYLQARKYEARMRGKLASSDIQKPEDVINMVLDEP